MTRPLEHHRAVHPSGNILLLLGNPRFGLMLSERTSHTEGIIQRGWEGIRALCCFGVGNESTISDFFDCFGQSPPVWLLIVDGGSLDDNVDQVYTTVHLSATYPQNSLRSS